jgi:hypothetical protein
MDTKTPSEYIIWGTPPDSNKGADRDEAGQTIDQVLHTQARTMDEARKIQKILEDEHGVTAVRIQVIDMSPDVDIAKMFVKAVASKPKRRK